MQRKVIDCRKIPIDINRTLAIAGTPAGVLDAPSGRRARA
jgi:hypothetical protein